MGIGKAETTLITLPFVPSRQGRGEKTEKIRFKRLYLKIQIRIYVWFVIPAQAVVRQAHHPERLSILSGSIY